MKSQLLAEQFLKLSKIKTPDDIFDELSTIKYDDYTPDNKYIIKTPNQVLQTKTAICYDMVELERQLFTNIGYKTFTHFIHDPTQSIEKTPTHTFLIFKENNKYYWFEVSWESYRAIRGTFETLNSACQYCIDKFQKLYKIKTSKLIEYKKFKYTNMNVYDFGKHIINAF